MSVKSGYATKGTRWRPTKDYFDATDVWTMPVEEIRLKPDAESPVVRCTSHDPSLDAGGSDYRSLLSPETLRRLQERER